MVHSTKSSQNKIKVKFMMFRSYFCSSVRFGSHFCTLDLAIFRYFGQHLYGHGYGKSMISVSAI